ncbi:MAG TPA: PVC-type heme-binding CxxCH protein [Chthoniobacteraceae bacterium]|jgi:putative membrane-bound dehydrogenase-like protein|nr:PVC-type heme-binding CxxCH protein [Chthoniobacteraceae bacterium]
MKPLLSALALFLSLLSLRAEPVALFDGKTLDGWDYDPKLWRLEEGMIAGGSLTEQVTHNDFLATKKTYANFELRVTLRLSGTGFVNSGVQIRSIRKPGSPEMSGYQVDYGKGWYGKLYDESRRGKVLSESVDQKAAEAAIKEGDWNEYRIRAEGRRIQSWINGVPALDYTEPDLQIAQDGLIGIQIHGGGKAVVHVKSVTIEELPPTADVMTWEKLSKLPKPAAGGPQMKEGNALAAVAKTPEEELATFTVPQGFKVELVASEDVANGIGKFVPIAFDQQGRLWTTTALEYPVDGNENPAAADALYASKAKDKVLIYDRDPSTPTGYAAKPRVFAEGLAIPLGVLPYKNGCYVQHGHDIAFLEDTDGDGKADKRTVILTGFGVQDSHLFPHQFMRAPGGWIWMAQGAFNYGKVSRPGEEEKAVQFDQTRMAKFRPDGSEFDITSNGPCNIWGLVLNGEGEAFIQEANDYGYPVMPFHEYANYPGCSNRQWKSYAPEFPGTAPEFRMGGTGLSGLALTDGAGIFPAPWADVMLVANPITNRLNAIKMLRDGPRWKLEKLPDFLASSDPWFRPVAITMGPDGCLYIVDWYNKIISHNEVPRNHPDRDKTRGRIWRVRPDGHFLRTAAGFVTPAAGLEPLPVPDFTKLSGEELIAKLGGPSLTQSHLAWQAIGDREMKELAPKLREIAMGSQVRFFSGAHDKDEVESKLRAALSGANSPPAVTTARRIAGLWALTGLHGLPEAEVRKLLEDKDRNIRREAIRVLGQPEQDGLTTPPVRVVKDLDPLEDDPDPEVRAECIRKVAGVMVALTGTDSQRAVMLRLVNSAGAPLDAPTAPSTQNNKPIKVGEAYDREFERYLVRKYLELQPSDVAKFLDSPEAAARLTEESRLLATLALDPKASASRVAALLPKLQRPPGQEELLRLAQFPEEPGVGDALKAVLANPATSTGALDSLLAMKTRLDAAKLAPLLGDIARSLLASADAAALDRGIRLTSAFQLGSAEPALAAAVQAGLTEERDVIKGTPMDRISITLTPPATQALKALREMRGEQVDLFNRLARFGVNPEVREEALRALASARSPKAVDALLKLWPHLDGPQRRAALELLVSTKPGANAAVAALGAGQIEKTDLDGPILDKLQAVLGTENPELTRLVDSLGALFRPVLALDGSEAAWTQTAVTLEGPCTIEGWVRLDPQGRKINNNDGLGGAPGRLDLNFFGERPRVYAYPPLGDVVIAKKPFTPGLWTHLAATRDAAGLWKIYIDGELDNTATKAAPGKIENLRIGWTSARGGTQGAISEFRLWNRERTADEIRAASDRGVPSGTADLLFTSAAGDWGKLQAGAKIVKTTDYPPILSGDEAAVLDAKYTKFRALANQPGDAARGKAAAALCQACHLMGPVGGNIGPNLSGVGAMGTEAILRNILQPNAAMENGYRIYRVELKNGDLVDALFVSEDKDAVVIRQPGTGDRRLPRAEIRDTKYLRRSLMPEGLLETFTPEQVSDLFAYLRTLK